MSPSPPDAEDELPIVSQDSAPTSPNPIAVSYGYGPIPTVSISPPPRGGEGIPRHRPSIGRPVRATGRWALRYLSRLAAPHDRLRRRHTNLHPTLRTGSPTTGASDVRDTR